MTLFPFSLCLVYYTLCCSLLRETTMYYHHLFGLVILPSDVHFHVRLSLFLRVGRPYLFSHLVM
jgi:hypothetical protein